ncbi:MAG: peptidase M14 [Flammeovirgaceae bacterium]|nr:peptidase M14 [Flammeovirgaceae bacterium]
MQIYILSIIGFLTFFMASAQPNVVDKKRFSFEPELEINEKIPSPKKVLTYELGSSFTLYADVVSYFKALSASSERVLYNEYGKTYEGRPLINLVISSEENIKNIDDIKFKHMQILQEAKVDKSLLKDQPTFTSFSYNIHGNEASSTEAAMQVAYRMAAAQDDETKGVLKNSVIIMYICINPDGRDRYVYWYKSMKRLKRSSKEPQDIEHIENWPGGRTNHYWFDLNRDWVWQVHPEARGLSEEYQKWLPQVHVDYHEQGYNNNYFTAPGTTPRNQLLPDSYERWSKVFGDANIAQFDKHQINYFTRDRFDFFYPGYGSSYPSVMGAIGMLTEQGGGSAGGRIVRTEDGVNLTLRQRIFDHYTTSIATIKTAVLHREKLLNYSKKALNPASSKSKIKAYFFSDQEVYSNDLVNILIRNGIKVEQALDDFQITAAQDYRSGRTSKKVFNKGTYIVTTLQSKHLLINTIMARNLEIEDSVMYDMATWSAPLAYNLEAYSTVGGYTAKTKQISQEVVFKGSVINSSAQYAYVIDWSQRNAPQALAQLWAKKYNVRSAFEPFYMGDQTFPAGSLILLRGRNLDHKDEMDQEIKEIAQKAGVEIIGFNSGRVITGMDLANSRNVPIKQPNVALMVEPPFSTYTAGQIYFLFDWQTGLPIDRIKATMLQQSSFPKFGSRSRGVDLKDYDVLILPNGGSGLSELFEKESLDQIKDWVNEGGTLIATEGAASFFTKEFSDFTEISMKKYPKDSSLMARSLTYDQRTAYEGKKRIPGTALNAKIDITHPLAFGLKAELYTLKFGTDALVPNVALETVGSYSKLNQLNVAGYISPENLSHLAENTFAGVVNMGRGKIVYLIDNTQYRMFWMGPSRMMQNAVMQIPGY